MASGRKLRRPLSLTPLIDVIFLLLLFFMLSSTFSDFAEIDLVAGAPGGAAPDGPPPAFLQLSPRDLRLNGEAVPLSGLSEALVALGGDAGTPPEVVVSLDGAVDAQRLTDLLALLSARRGVSVTVLGAR